MSRRTDVNRSCTSTNEQTTDIERKNTQIDDICNRADGKRRLPSIFDKQQNEPEEQENGLKQTTSTVSTMPTSFTSSSASASTSALPVRVSARSVKTQRVSEDIAFDHPIAETEPIINQSETTQEDTNVFCSVSLAAAQSRKQSSNDDRVANQQTSDTYLSHNLNSNHQHASMATNEIDVAALAPYIRFCFSPAFIDTLDDTTERAEYVDLLHYLFVEWCTLDEQTVSEPISVRHTHFLHHLQSWILQSGVLREVPIASGNAAGGDDAAEAASSSGRASARGKRGKTMLSVEDLRLPSVRVLAERRLNARYSRLRSDRYRPHAGAALISTMRSALSSTLCVLAIEDVVAMRARMGARASSGAAVRFRVMRDGVAMCDSSTTIRVPLPFALSVPATLVAWREYVRDVAMRPITAQYLRAYAVLCVKSNSVYCVMISNGLTCTCEENGPAYVQCMHVLFVLVRVLRLPLNDYMLHQRTLVDAELFVLFTRRSVVEQLSDTYWRNSRQHGVGRRRPLLLDSECRVCCTACNSASDPYCIHCGRNFHSQCMALWREHQDDVLAARCPVCLLLFEQSDEEEGETNGSHSRTHD
jgi:hypothetical protein